MIKGTNADCKIVNISVSENLATITLLIFATKATVPAKSFKVCIKDIETKELFFANNNVYWIDQTNNYDLDSNNIDTKKYKEIIITVDISKSSTGIIKDNRWARNCMILLMDTGKNIDAEPAWSSGIINLISNKFETPTIKNLSLDTVKNKIKAKFSVIFKTKKSFASSSKNFIILFNIRNIGSNEILESKEITLNESTNYNEIITDYEYDLGQPVGIQILVMNKSREYLSDVKKIYRPSKKYSNSFVKTENGIKRILFVYVYKAIEDEHEGDWL